MLERYAIPRRTSGLISNSAPTFQPTPHESPLTFAMPSLVCGVMPAPAHAAGPNGEPKQAAPKSIALLSVALKYWKLSPPPSDTLSRTFQAIAGLTLIDSRTESIAWYRPIQLTGYFVFRPNGALMPIPALSFGARSVAKYRFGTQFNPTGLPPVPPVIGNAGPAGEVVP